MLVTDESTEDQHAIHTAELYDSPTGNWTNAGYMHFDRGDHTAAVLTDGNVLVTGGTHGGHLCILAQTAL
jgi:hypothetical protein